MTTIDELIEHRPHLKDSLRMHEKIKGFEDSVLALPIQTYGLDIVPITLEHVCYPVELIRPVFENFSRILNVPGDMLAALEDAMAIGRIDLMRLPLNEVPSFSLPYQENELATILFLIGRPYFIWMKRRLNLDGMFWEEGRCNVCNAAPLMASVKSEAGKIFYCPFCGSRGRWHRIGCPDCGNRDTNKLETMEVKGEPGFSLNMCNECKGYHKTVESGLLDSHTPELLDILSMPLDITAQNKGCRRPSPNPLGAREMV